MVRNNRSFKRYSTLPFRKIASCFIATITLVSVLSYGNYKKDIDRRTVDISGNIRTEASIIDTAKQDVLASKMITLDKVNTRNSEIAAEVVADASPVIKNTIVSLSIPIKSFKGYPDAENNTHGYIVENSTNEVVNGVENLKIKYAAYLTYDGEETVWNDATYLYILEQECAKWNLDPFFMMGVIMTESRGQASAKNKRSTAVGLGQVLKGSGKWAYEDLLGNGKGTYDHSMAYDPATNIKMAVAIMGQAVQSAGGDILQGIWSYRGVHDQAYVKSIRKFMNMSGHTPNF